MNPPKGWKTYRLDEVAVIQGGGTPRRSEASYFDGSIPWVTPSDLSAIGTITELDSTKEGITAKGLANSSAKLIDPGSVLFSSRASIGKIAVTNKPCATNQGFANLTPFPELDKWFLAYLLCRYIPEITALAGKTTFLEVPRGKLKAFEIALPPVSEQRRIVARIKECMERVEEIEQLRAAAITEGEATLPSVLNETFVELSGTYPSDTIGDVALETRYGTSNKCGMKPTGVAILRIPNVAGGFVNLEDLKYCALDPSEKARLLLKDGDLLFVRTNGSRNLVGRCAIFEGAVGGSEFAFASYLIRVRLDQKKVLPHYLVFFLSSTHGRAELNKRRRTSAGQFNINSENLRSIALPVPPLEVQHEVIETLQERQRQIIQLQQELRSAQREESGLRESILCKAFSGEL